MNILASLIRVVFSIIVLLALACYLQLDSTVSLSEYQNSITPARLIVLLSDFNAVSISLVIIILAGILHFTRILEAAWNILFCAAILILLPCALYAFGGPEIALPSALYHNDTVLQLCETAQEHQVAVALVTFIFIAGWICASACVRVAITAVISFGLWYGLTEMLTYIVEIWAKSANPVMPEALQMIQSSPWIIAAVPGSFFLIYALLMAFFETFITKPARKLEIPTEEENKQGEEIKPIEYKKDTTEETKTPAEPAKKKPALKAPQPAYIPPTKAKLATPVITELKKSVEAAAPAETENKPEAPAKTIETPPAETAEDKPAESAKDEEIEKNNTAPLTDSSEKS